MKTITFRPLRRIKKTGKVTVASYMSWYKIQTADYGKFKLIINTEYKMLPPHELVYDHEGNQLFWFKYHPADIPVFNYSILFDLDKIREENKHYAINWQSGNPLNYNAKGLDCSGTPIFSHYTEKHIKDNYKDTKQFKPLTVEMVVNLFGWFLYQLQNNELVFSHLAVSPCIKSKTNCA